MKKVVWLIILLNVSKIKSQNGVPASKQLPEFRNMTEGETFIWTSSTGAPVDNTFGTNSLNTNLLNHPIFFELHSHFVRERIPERVVHAKGAGAFGYFEVTDDVKDICRAEFLNEVGKKTPVAIRFSPIVGPSGVADTIPDARGFAIKFYTTAGNFDMVGLNLPTFPIKDPLFFPSLNRNLKRNPVTHLLDVNARWDFLTLHPEAIFTFMGIFGDPGIPDGYRHMPGFSVHTYQLVNEQGESYFVRFHFTPDAGFKFLTAQEGQTIAGQDADYNVRDLYNSISNGSYPSWTLYFQVLCLEDLKKAKFDVFDVTRILPIDEYPLRKVGKLVLNKNPDNYFADVEQIAFCPSNLVDGILGSPDKLFESRRFSYIDAQNYRLGANFDNIEVNCPFRAQTYTYNRDGVPPVRKNGKGSPNYFPNSFNGPVPKDAKAVTLIKIVEKEPYNFDQARDLYRSLTDGPRDRLIQGILTSLGQAIPELQEKALKYFRMIDSDLAKRLQEGLKTCS